MQPSPKTNSNNAAVDLRIWPSASVIAARAWLLPIVLKSDSSCQFFVLLRATLHQGTQLINIDIATLGETYLVSARTAQISLQSMDSESINFTVEAIEKPLCVMTITVQSFDSPLASGDPA